ncbi:MAG: AAA family ATPase [Asgard group archaeon]|nr:AAA family ATPase [Asgard group archaeon]
MGKRGRPRKIVHDDDDDDDNSGSYGNGSHSRRATRRISYKESDDDEDFDDLDTPKDENEEDAAPPEGELPKEDGNEEDDYKEEPAYDDDDEQAYTPRPKRRKTLKPKRRISESDDEFEAGPDDDETEDDDAMFSDDDEDEVVTRRKKVDDFIVKDENDWDDDEDDEDASFSVTGKKKRGRKKKSSQNGAKRTRSHRMFDGLDITLDQPEQPPVESDGELNIQKEIADLYDSSPIHGDVEKPHKLRQRTKVDYTIPPPITNDLQLEKEFRAATPTNVRKRGRTPNPRNEFRKILYPTAGPFGGSDVISIFGTNIPPAGIPIPGAEGIPGTSGNLTALGQSAIDSDSSEDEIAPINGEATISKKTPKTRKPSIGGTGAGKLFTGGSDDSNNKKKKNNLSDTDPLGVDMNIDFSVVGGLDNYINQLKEMVALPLLYPELYQNFGITPPRGVLFHGPPGTGKTLMARALAASCSTEQRKITFFMRKGADCLSKWVGEAERQLRLLFEEAKNQQPSIIFFDEIDGLAPVRSSKQEQIHASIVSTLLALMDGMDNRGQVIVIGATNRPDAIDPALRRPGRFDREFYFPLPDINSRKDILKIHTRKWTPPLPDVFLESLAELTKGYGGADLRALCTEAALNSIQRKYPQIYETNEKLLVHPSKVKVIAKDFMKAIEKIVPSSARSTSSGSAPLPDHLKPLLEAEFNEIVEKLEQLLPNSVGMKGKKKFTALDEAKYLDPTINDEDGGFAKQQLLKTLENSIICRPHLLISGSEGNGQQYLSAAVLNHLEGFQVQSLDLGTMFGDTSRTPELAIVQAFIEARRHQPSILFIPNIDIWFQVLPDPARATLTSLLRGLKSNEKLLLLGISETPIEDLSADVRLMFGLENHANNVILYNPSRSSREAYFGTLKKTLLMKPYEFVNDLENRPKRKLKQLKVVQSTEQLSDEVANKRKLKEQEYKDTKLKNVLKIKLAALMDLFKVRYRKFRKPIIDESFLAHLFDPTILKNPLNNYMVLYVHSDDPGHENMIKELSTGKYYYNMDLDLIEERLWNGFYSEPKQFLKDLKMIVKDCFTSGDRERILKANEMMTNAQFGVDDFSTPEFLKACREVRERDIIKQKKLLEEHEKLQAELAKQQQQLEIVQEAEEGQAEKPVVVINDTTVPSGVAESEEKPVVETIDETLKEIQVDGVNGGSTTQEVEEEIKQNGPIPIEEKPVPVAEDVEMKDAANVEVNGTSETKQVEEEKSVEPVLDPKETSTEAVEDPEVSEIIADQTMEDSESEAEEELDIDLTKEIEIDLQKLDNLSQELLDITEHYNVEKLEIAMARLMDVIWRDRNQWDKSATLDNLKNTIDSIKATL